jgi:hypothetical protein
MRKIVITGATVLLLMVTFGALPAYAIVAGVSFGGRVVSIQPCNTGLLAYLKTSKGPMPVMWFWGELPFLSYIPPHPGQQMLGKVGTALSPCVLGSVTYGAGLPVLYHGSSI